MSTTLGKQLRACSPKQLPTTLLLANTYYTRTTVFKHDFFAATALYQKRGQGDFSTPTEPTVEKRGLSTFPPTSPSITAAPSAGKVDCPLFSAPTGQRPPTLKLMAPAENLPDKIILKLSRQNDLLGIPLRWLGELLAGHELAVLQHLAHIPGLPRVLGRLDHVGFAYEFIEGCSLDDKPKVPNDYFERLYDLLGQIHARRVAYIDMNKRGNLLLRPDGSPGIIDFQISFHIPRAFLGSKRLTNKLLQKLQTADLYHLTKHKRRFRPDLMTPEQIAESRQISTGIAFHRRIARPLTKIRRKTLAHLFKSGHITDTGTEDRSPENDPKRWLYK